MDKFEYFGGVLEVGIVPRAPHAGPLLRELFEQEHGRGGFAGKVSHTYHLYPPTNWLADETKVLDGFAPAWESPLRPLGGVHHALRPVSEAVPDIYRGMARLVANASAAMNVVVPQASMEYFFEHHSATMVFFIHRGEGTLETTFGPLTYRPGDFLMIPKGITHRFELGPGPYLGGAAGKSHPLTRGGERRFLSMAFMSPLLPGGRLPRGQAPAGQRPQCGRVGRGPASHR